MTYYRDDLALAHHRGFGFHADRCAPGILGLLAPVLDRGGPVLELGCGTGGLTRHLTDAGHRVIATDASPSMLRIAAGHAPGAQEVRRLTLPDAAAVHRALTAIARALRPGGVLAIDLCDLRYGTARDLSPAIWRGDDWAMMTGFSLPEPDRFVRDITVFTRADGECWHRDDEHHENVLIDTTAVPALLAAEGVQATVGRSFGAERLPDGLAVITGTRPA